MTKLTPLPSIEREPMVILRDWSVIVLGQECPRNTLPGDSLLFGWYGRTLRGTWRISSQVVWIDADAMIAMTMSGRKYELRSPWNKADEVSEGVLLMQTHYSDAHDGTGDFIALCEKLKGHGVVQLIDVSTRPPYKMSISKAP